MALDHSRIAPVVAIAVGLIVFYGSYQWITNSDRTIRRTREEVIVLAGRDILKEYVTDENLEISDALDRVRTAGKVYIFPTSDGWELSGHYRRRGEKLWHDYLMSLDADVLLVSLSVNDSDPELQTLAAADPKFSTSR
jgi:hypothetical protein